MKNMKIVIFIIMQPARVESTSRMKLMRKQSVKVIDHPSFDVHNTLAAQAKSIFSMVDREALAATFGAAQRNAQGRWERFREGSVSS